MSGESMEDAGAYASRGGISRHCIASAARVQQTLRSFLVCIALMYLHQEGFCLRDRVLVIERNIYTVLQSPSAMNIELHVM